MGKFLPKPSAFHVEPELVHSRMNDSVVSLLSHDAYLYVTCVSKT